LKIPSHHSIRKRLGQGWLGARRDIASGWPGFDGAYLKDIPASSYAGERLPDGRVLVEKVDENGDLWPLDPRLDLWSHSPDGFNFGCAGSGPSQLALAILFDPEGNSEDPAGAGHARPFSGKGLILCHTARPQGES
jgi:hypothetical protein